MREFCFLVFIFLLCNTGAIAQVYTKGLLGLAKSTPIIKASVERSVALSRIAVNPLPISSDVTKPINTTSIALDNAPKTQLLEVAPITTTKLQFSNVSYLSNWRAPLLLPAKFPNKKMIDAVIFDMDGTLIDSLGAWDSAAVNFIKSKGLEPIEGLQEELVQMSLQAGAKKIQQEYALELTVEEILEQTISPVRERYFTDIEAKPGVVELLEKLKNQGIKMCVATSSDRNLAEGALTRLGIRDYFEFIITSDDVGVGKRSALIYYEALGALGTEKNRTLVVEDAAYALQTAHKAGFMTAGVDEAHSSDKDVEIMRKIADFYIFSYEE